MAGKFTGAMKAVKAAKQQAVKEEVQNSVSTEDQVSLTIKVPRSLRQHWQVEAKKRGTSVTALIVDYFTEELGLPD